MGYAFINFVSAATAAAFYSQWQGCRLPGCQQGRPLNIVVAETQGFWSNLFHLRQKSAGRLRSRRCRPIIVRDGQLLDMDEACLVEHRPPLQHLIDASFQSMSVVV